MSSPGRSILPRLALALALLLGQAACTSLTRPLDTPSGRPEVVVRGVTNDHVVTFLHDEAMERGFHWDAANGRRALFSRVVEGLEARLVSGAKWGTQPELLVTVDWNDGPDGRTLIVARVELVANRGTEKEKAKDLSSATHEAHEVQKLLEAVQGSAALAHHAAALRDLEQRERHPAAWSGIGDR